MMFNYFSLTICRTSDNIELNPCWKIQDWRICAMLSLPSSSFSSLIYVIYKLPQKQGRGKPSINWTYGLRSYQLVRLALDQRYIWRGTWCSSGRQAGHKPEIIWQELKFERGTLTKVILPQAAGWSFVRSVKLQFSISATLPVELSDSGHCYSVYGQDIKESRVLIHVCNRL
jgi:hypothetical protein